MSRPTAPDSAASPNRPPYRPPVACIANAVVDAILHLGGRIRDSHLAPQTVLRALRVP